MPAPTSDHSNLEPANINGRYFYNHMGSEGVLIFPVLQMKIIPLRPALFLNGSSEDQTSAASDRDPLGNPEIIN